MSFQQGRRKLKRNRTTHLFGIAMGLTNHDCQAQCLLAQCKLPHASSLKMTVLAMKARNTIMSPPKDVQQIWEKSRSLLS